MEGVYKGGRLKIVGGEGKLLKMEEDRNIE